MKFLIASLFALTLAGAASADVVGAHVGPVHLGVGVGHHYHHQHCGYRHHHRVCW